MCAALHAFFLLRSCSSVACSPHIGTAGSGSTIEGTLFPDWAYLLFISNFWSAWLGEWGFRPLSLFVVARYRGAILPRRASSDLVAPSGGPSAGNDSGNRLGTNIQARTVARLATMIKILHALSPILQNGCPRNGRLACVAHTATEMVPRTTRLICLARLCNGNTWRLTCAAYEMARGSGQSLACNLGYTSISFACAGILLLLELSPQSRVAKLLSTLPITMIGRLSYFTYLFQTLVVGVAISLIFSSRFAVASPETAGQLTVGLVCLFLVAWLSFQLVESPILSTARRFRY